VISLTRPNGRIYLDNAATSWPKPPEVVAAVSKHMTETGAPCGRSAYTEAVEVSHEVERARKLIAELINAEDPSRIVFTFNGTDALNLAIRGLALGGGQVVTTVLEHNSVLRPLRFLHETASVGVTYAHAKQCMCVSVSDIHSAMSGNTALLAVTHASNVTGCLQPVAEIAEIARQYGALLLVDAAQSVGHVPIDVRGMGIDLLAAPGHKGLLGPLGTGFLYIRPGIEEELVPLRFGGTGTASESDRQPRSIPDKYESGNLNVPGILGLAAGIRYIQERGLERIRDHEIELTSRLIEGMRAIRGIHIHSPSDPARMVGVVSITIEGFDPQEVAAVLDSRYRIQVRAGLHCAPFAHRSLGTAATGGTIRFGPGPFTTMDDIDAAVAAAAEIVAGMREN
jgi:cysteine desulfurase/selenocysteine lyase